MTARHESAAGKRGTNAGLSLQTPIDCNQQLSRPGISNQVAMRFIAWSLQR
jgi:hypothetical protein